MASPPTPTDLTDVEEWFRLQAHVKSTGAALGYQGQLTPEFQETIARLHAPDLALERRFEEVIEFDDGVVGEGLDLRGYEAAWLGDVILDDQRVVEYAPSGGWMSAFIAKRARELVTFDQDPGSPLSVAIAQSGNPTGLHLLGYKIASQVRNGWWFSRARLGFSAKATYGDLEDPPRDLGSFDIAVLARVLPTSPNPYRILGGAARLAETIVVTERLASDDPSETDPARPGIGVFRPNLAPGAFRFWWYLAPSAVSGMLRELGFTDQTLTTHKPQRGPIEPYYTIVARRPSRSPTQIPPSIETAPPPPTPDAPSPDVELIATRLVTFDELRTTLEANQVKLEKLGRVLDFGCGTGRMLPDWLQVPGIEVFATDVDPVAIAGVSARSASVQAAVNKLRPALSYPDNHFGLVCAISVFTHLPETLQATWCAELLRILKPNGLLYFTTNGESHQDRLDADQADAFDTGEIVVSGAEAAGTNQCHAYHPASWVYREMLEPTGARLVKHIAMGADDGQSFEDGWLVRKIGGG